MLRNVNPISLREVLAYAHAPYPSVLLPMITKHIFLLFVVLPTENQQQGREKHNLGCVIMKIW